MSWSLLPAGGSTIADGDSIASSLCSLLLKTPKADDALLLYSCVSLPSRPRISPLINQYSDNSTHGAEKARIQR